ncbi:MotA/TolQ/ExbB proton channel family protein [Brumimicrobium glaciale]|jgi:biopolymer transport protein ExbB|uniref:MotA/TolQ/ExbB proton channel family protein n=1 Tax=Brumimicrobium glaciale TaxID=200475 RepID=A0A4Q4KL65_9FLAO|nr:MotA/TolQ/ExbB proton channel family protein [Brumimicrobium glaciale]RYM32569.1 MotA/TolQ/ExbB proton channel family protein [Brumimicrobium glaciale]
MKGSFLLQVVQDSTGVGVEEGYKEVAIWEAVSDAASSAMGLIILVSLALMSIYAVYVFVERLLALKRASKKNPNFLSEVKRYLSEGKIDEAKNLCARTDSPSARMLEKGISRLGKPVDIVASTIDNTGKLEISRLEQRLSFLATAAGAAPMIGFLGTTIGMVQVFNDMKNLDSLDLGTIAPGIMTAMITTVAGLIVGIIAFMGYNYLVTQISKVVYRMENDAMEFMDILHTPSK